MRRLAQAVPPTAEELKEWPRYPGQRRYEKYVRFSTVEAVKAGWLEKRSGLWTIRPDGRAALDRYPDPLEFQREAARRYRAWLAARDTNRAETQLEIGPWADDDDSAGESEEDLALHQRDIAAGAVLAPTDWTVGTILGQLQKGNIELNPAFQRRDAWKTATRKSKFIESVILGLPIPQIVLAESKDRKGTYLVIDGKQRLLSLRQFAASEDDEFNPLVLAGLDVRPDLNGLTLEELRADERFGEELAAFENQTIRTVVVRQWPNEDFLYLVFLRLNTGSVPLSPQELRQALHPGPFMDFADEFAEQSDVIHDALGVTQPDFRMRDVELLIRFLAFDRFLESYAGNLKQFLDFTCLRLNELWGEENEQIEASAASCDSAIASTVGIFGDGAFRRWTGTKWERRFNRAVFDAQTFYFKDLAVATAALARAEDVVEAFRSLSNADQAFSQSLQTTTKSVAATYTRLAAWGTLLSEVLNLRLRVPTLQGNRIRYD